MIAGPTCNIAPHDRLGRPPHLSGRGAGGHAGPCGQPPGHQRHHRGSPAREAGRHGKGPALRPHARRLQPDPRRPRADAARRTDGGRGPGPGARGGGGRRQARGRGAAERHRDAGHALHRAAPASLQPALSGDHARALVYQPRGAARAARSRHRAPTLPAARRRTGGEEADRHRPVALRRDQLPRGPRAAGAEAGRPRRDPVRRRTPVRHRKRVAHRPPGPRQGGDAVGQRERDLRRHGGRPGGRSHSENRGRRRAGAQPNRHRQRPRAADHLAGRAPRSGARRPDPGGAGVPERDRGACGPNPIDRGGSSISPTVAPK